MVQQERFAGAELRVQLGSAHRDAVRTLSNLVGVSSALHGLGVQFSWEPLFLKLLGLGPTCPWGVLVAGVWEGSDLRIRLEPCTHGLTPLERWRASASQLSREAGGLTLLVWGPHDIG